MVALHPSERGPIVRPLIIVPTYNESGNVDPLGRAILQQVPSANILFIDDNSSDTTQVEIRRMQQELGESIIHLLTRPAKLGLGTAYISGFRWGLERSYDAMIEMDADHSHRPEDLAKLVAALAGSDGIVGSRYVPGGSTVNWSFLRKCISRFGSWYARMILHLPLQDLTGGFNAWRRGLLQTIPLHLIRSEGYAFQIELKCRAHRHGFQLQEIPIAFVERRAGKSKMSWRIVLEAMGRVWSLRGVSQG